MRKLVLPHAPLALSVVLGPMVKRALRQSLTMFQGSYDIFYTRPICAGLLLPALAVLLWPLIGSIGQWRRRRAAGQ